jgi:transcription elongation factor Elf1
MSKLQKETHVHIPCPACGKTERVKLKWAQKHKSLKCGKCKETVDLRANPARSLIARTADVLTTFEMTMDALHAEAKRLAKGAKAQKKKSKPKKAAKKKAAKKQRTRKAGTPQMTSAPSLSGGPGPV